MKRVFFATILAVLGVQFASSDQLTVTKFKGLNNNENSVIIAPEEAQDLLNIDVTPGAQSVKKRSGYGVYKALATGQAVHGGYHAFDSSGNDYQLWGSSTSLYGIVSDGTPTHLVSSATVNSTWDCADTQGNSYCVTSNRDLYLITNGTTKTWLLTPLGTMIESTPDRVVVAGVSGSPNTLYVSGSNSFQTYTVGVNPTDPFNEVIASPGSKLTHIRWACGKLLWWKDQSFGYFDFEDQFQAQVKTVSNTIGTFDNTSAVDPGGQVWFRGQDGHTYMYDCSALTKESIDITPNVVAAGKRTANLWTQTAQSDWQAGVSTPSVNFSLSISPGDVVLSSFTDTDTAAADFSQGTTNNTTVTTFGVKISTNNSGNVDDYSFENGTVPNVSSSWSQLSSGISLSLSHIPSGFTCTQIPHAGSQQIGSEANNTVDSMTAYLMDSVAVSTWASTSISPSANNTCGWNSYTLSSTANIGKRFRLKLQTVQGGLTFGVLSANAFVLGGTITFYAWNSYSGAGKSMAFWDDVREGSSTITSGSFTSRVFDTSITSTVVLGQANWTVNTSTPYFEVQSASNSTTGPWKNIASSSNTSATNGARYIRYLSSFTIGPTDTVFTTLDDATIIAKSTGGVFASQVKNAPNLNAWSTFGANTQNLGGSHTFYIRSSTYGFTTSSTTPAWTAQSAGALVGVSTGTYFQVRDDFTATSATAALALNDFTVNWFEGNATDQAYMIYFDNAIWESVAFGSGQSSNNYIFKYDLINEGWTLYNFGAGGMLIQANTLYFGDTSSTGGNIFNYGSVTSDNGTAINSYWRSKSFTGTDPFLQNAVNQIDIFAKKDQGTSLTATYTLDTSSATAYSISLSTTNAVTQSRKQLPSGKMGYTWDLKLGDASTSSAWEILGYRIMFTPQPYRPVN